jgi:hypothetical protein
LLKFRLKQYNPPFVNSPSSVLYPEAQSVLKNANNCLHAKFSKEGTDLKKGIEPCFNISKKYFGGSQ